MKTAHAQADRWELARAREAAMSAAARAAKAASEAEAAVMAQAANRAADPASYAFALEASRRAKAAAGAAAAASAAAQSATTLEEARRQRDIARAKRMEASREEDDAARYAGMVRTAHETSPEVLARAAAQAAEAAEAAWRAAQAALAAAGADRYADLAGYARVKEAVYLADEARRHAAAAANARSAATPEEAAVQRGTAEALRRAAEEHLAAARSFAARVRTARMDPSYVPPALRAAPLFEYSGRVNIGSRPPPPAGGFAAAGTRGGVRLSTGPVRDGASAEDVLAYLRWTTTHVDANHVDANAAGLASHPEPPLVSIAEGTGRRFADLAALAVEIVNAALPYGKRLALDARRAPDPGNTDLNPLPEGSIVIHFLPEEDWPYRFAGGNYPLGVAFPRRAYRWHEERQRWENSYGESSHILYNTAHEPQPDRLVLYVLVQELLHAMGFDVHTDPAGSPARCCPPPAPTPYPRTFSMSSTAMRCLRPTAGSGRARCRRR